MIHKTIDIWENTNFDYEVHDGFRPTLVSYILEGDKKRPAILICPGGGYSFTSPREAEPIAMQFNAAGFHAFVLYYSVHPSRYPQALLDASRSMTIIRQNKDEWNILNDKVLICGFSAGGHLSASLGVHFNKDYIDVDGVDKDLVRPDGMILSYPVISSGEFTHEGSMKNLLGRKAWDPEARKEVSLEKQVHRDTPPSFLWHTYEDDAVDLENVMLFSMALREKDINFELHIYPKGAHGLSLATEETSTEDLAPSAHVASWMKLCIKWIKEL